MATINLYKIEKGQKEKFFESVKKKYNILGEKNITINSKGDDEQKIEKKYNMKMFFSPSSEEKELSWNWALKLFGKTELSKTSPSGFISIETEENTYAISFSFAYFNIDPYCDKNFPFEFARRLEYKNIRTTALTNPNSMKNKTINTYLDYSNLDFDSGESLSKIKGKVRLPDNFELFNETIEIGNSIKFIRANPSLEDIARIIEYVEEVIEKEEEKVKIPLLQRITDEKIINSLNETLLNDIEDDNIEIDFSEYQIYATNVVFNQNFEYKLKYKTKTEDIDILNEKTIREFADKHKLNKKDLLDIKVIVHEDNKSKFTTTVKKLMFYTNEKEKAILTNGEWYKYNDDYLKYLHDSLSELTVEYDKEYDFNEEDYEKFLEEKFNEEKLKKEYDGLKEETIKAKIKAKYYKEIYYNTRLVNKGFKSFDRDLENLGKHKIEVMDLYKDNTMYSVKIGNSSGKLCYAVDQSIEALKMYHRKQLTGIPKIEKVCLWLVLDRKTPLRVINGVPDINDMNMLILKNKIDIWKKEVRILGYTPIIKINYVQKKS
jgi:uncharacterized protein (TIGR04141 family)